MRKIKLEKRKDFEDDAAMVKSIVNHPGQEGFTVETMKSSLAITDALVDGADELTLEEADWKYLKGKLAAFKWGMPSKYIIDLCGRINNAKEVTIN